jgi:hypothetical protein
MVVNLARPWVMAVAKIMCHVVRKSAVVRALAVRSLDEEEAGMIRLEARRMALTEV